MRNDAGEDGAVRLNDLVHSTATRLCQVPCQVYTKQDVARFWPWAFGYEVKVELTRYLAARPICPEKIFCTDLEFSLQDVIVDHAHISRLRGGTGSGFNFEDLS